MSTLIILKAIQLFKQIIKSSQSRLSFPILGDLLLPGIAPVSFASPTLAREIFTTEPPGKSQYCLVLNLKSGSLLK